MITEELAPEHFEIVARWLSNPGINRWLTTEWRNREVTSNLITIAVRNQRNRLFLVRHEGRPCGLVGLADLELTDSTGMVWYFLGEPELSGRGIISKAVRQLVGLLSSTWASDPYTPGLWKTTCPRGRYC
jgi:RimJ/RimL family protein N-acetyltransferase